MSLPSRLARLALVAALVSLCTCRVTAPPPPGFDTSARLPVDDSECADWSPLYGTRCIFQERPETPCPPPYSRLFDPRSNLPATLCCPGSALESVPEDASIVGLEPGPLTPARALYAITTALDHQLRPPQACPGAPEACDTYVGALYACWRRATPEARSFLEPHSLPGCRAWSAGDPSSLRTRCEEALDALLEHPACKP